MFYNNCFINAQNIDDIIRVAEIGDNLIFSGRGKIIYKSTFFDVSDIDKIYEDLKGETNATLELALNMKGEIDFAFQKNLFSVTTTILETYYMKEKYVYDGEKLYTLKFYDKKEGPPNASGTIDNYNVKKRSIKWEADPRYHYNIFGEPVAEFLRRDAHYIGEEEKNGVECKVFQGTTYLTESDIVVWLGPSEMYYRPVHLELLELNKSEYDFEYTESNNLLILKKIVNNNFNKDSNNNWTLVHSRTDSILEESKFNINLSDTLFQMNFPEDIRVIDKTEEPVKPFQMMFPDAMK